MDQGVDYTRGAVIPRAEQCPGERVQPGRREGFRLGRAKAAAVREAGAREWWRGSSGRECNCARVKRDFVVAVLTPWERHTVLA